MQNGSCMLCMQTIYGFMMLPAVSCSSYKNITYGLYIKNALSALVLCTHSIGHMTKGGRNKKDVLARQKHITKGMKLASIASTRMFLHHEQLTALTF